MLALRRSFHYSGSICSEQRKPISVTLTTITSTDA